MKIQNIIFIWILTSISLFAQTDDRTIVQIGFHGDVIFHPGVKISYQNPILNWQRTKPSKIKYKSILGGVEFTYYYNANHHHGLILGPSISYKRSKDNGKYIQFNLMAGIHRSIVDGPVYEFDSNEEIAKVALAGQTSFYNAISFQFGKRLNDRIAYYAEFGINGRTPYNNSYLNGIHTGIGIQYFLNR